MPQVNIKDTKILSDKKYVLKQVEFEMQKENGEWQSQKREVFDHGNAATALLYNKEKKTVLLTEQFRIASFVNGNSSGMLLETCAGLMEKGEAPEETLIREIKEETGYAVSKVEKIYEAYSSPGAVTELLHLYLAPYSDDQKQGEGGGLQNEGENVEVIELPFTEALSMLQRGEIRDVKTIILLQYLQLKNIL